jgi:type I restriction enzyme R subunit
MDKKRLSERDICTKFITPALEKVGWNIITQIREEFPLTNGRIIVRGKLHTRAKNKRSDYVLFYNTLAKKGCEERGLNVVKL